VRHIKLTQRRLACLGNRITSFTSFTHCLYLTHELVLRLPAVCTQGHPVQIIVDILPLASVVFKTRLAVADRSIHAHPQQC